MQAIPARCKRCVGWRNSSRDTRKAKRANLSVNHSIRQNIMKLKRIYNQSAFSISVISQDAMKRYLHVSL